MVLTIYGIELHLDSIFPYRIRSGSSKTALYGRYRRFSGYHQFNF